MATRVLCNDLLEVRPGFVRGEALDNLFMRCSELVRVQKPEEIQPGVPSLLVEPEIFVFDKRCNQKRNVAFFRRAPVPGEQSVAPYRYSNQEAPAQDMPDWLEALMAEVNAATGANFNAVLLNHYEDGTKYISKHRDSERGLVAKAPVAAISVGAVRNFRAREWPGGKKVADVPMEDGSLLVMHPGFQRRYTHEVPPQKKIKDERYSLTFREHVLV